jgi:hypothetical protein
LVLHIPACKRYGLAQTDTRLKTCVIYVIHMK